ncbi:hypothetical protein EST38_g1377 [Candolleomyces aberdarensis]|uniref:Nephrocystin 3-like N-terminal domain-containing protein n=1 Tax=Candolleomyces aberdarensis TaxID=2316362 RepID=A0A4Q2DV33_9AGAR|nr:hypothetical protein EST38_g1377 [Candolleomyces aberdarensis]
MQRVVVKLDRVALATLPEQEDVSGTRAEYMPNSRKLDVKKICKRLYDETELVVWLDGPAGVGKSTLVDHLSQKLRSAGLLAASLFSGAFPTDDKGPETIIKMLAHEVGKNHPEAIPKIVEAIDKCNGLSLQHHLKHYILEPLRSLAHSQALVVVVDAVDEWKCHPSFVKVLAHLNSETSTVKFIITSRLKPHRSRLPDFDKISVHSYPLRPVPQKTVKAYLDHHFKSIDWGREPSTRAEVDQLAKMSGGLLIWSAAVCSLLLHPFNNSTRHEIVSAILAGEKKVGSTGNLAKLYNNAIIRLFPSAEDRKYLRNYFGATIVLQEALPVSDFAQLVGMSPELVTSIQSTLSALQTKSPPKGSKKMVHPAATLFHLSFIEYVQATPTKNKISAFDSHSALGLACLEQITNLLSEPSNHISSSSLHGAPRYAVKYWPFHVSHGTNQSHDEWVKTLHCATLRALPVGAQRRWATLFLNVLFPKAKVVIEGRNMASILMEIGNKLKKDDSGDHQMFEVACLEVAARLG